MPLACAALVFQAPQLVSAIAQGCVTPGIDGPNATLTGVVNTYYPATASSAAGTNTITVGPRIAGAGPAIAAGDLLLVIQMQDGTINDSNTIAYGDGATGHGSTALNSTGLYEYVSAVSVVGAVITIKGSGAGNGLVNSYDFSNAVTTVVPIHGFQTFQVIRVPQYSSATVTAGLSATPWNGTLHAGGVLAIDVAGALNMNAQTISVNQLGFKGALGVAQAGPTNGATGTDFRIRSGNGQHGYKAEGIAGTPRFLYDAIGNAAVTTGPTDGYPLGDAARGAPGNAGGGGTDSSPVDNQENSGGGGGGNGGQGGQGGNTWRGNQPVGGRGGAVYPAAATKVVLGGGGGAGTRNNSAGLASSGGTGGGIVMIRTGSLAGAGNINANGGVGVIPVNDGGGGGGAGGSVVVTSNTGTVNGLTIHADGGNGTDAWPTGPTGAANDHGPGGGGGGGVIITSNALPLAQTSVLGGAHGTTTVDKSTFGSVDGSAGLVLTTTPGAIPGSSSGAECLPALTTAKTTSTPNVTNTGAGTTATYTITVANAANTGPATSVNISDALPAGFSYASTGSVVLNGGATRPATVNPTVGDTTPVFGTFTIPASASVVLTFTVNIAASVAPGTYNNPATATYLDPTRTIAGGTTTSSYAGGGAERVTVHAPDMTITKTHVDPLVRGSTSTYTLTATNSGNVATSGTVTVTDTLPAGLTPTGAAGTGWTCPAPVGQTITCTRSDALAGGASYPAITVTVTVLQTALNSVTNTASVSGGGETNTTNDTASDLTNIVSQADIAVTKTVSNATPNQNTNVTFTVTATNNGPSNATGVVVTDLLPAALTYVSSVASAGTSYVSGTGVWTIGAVANGANATLSIVATVTGTTAVTNTATKTAETETDPVAGNNSASATVTGQAADIAITKTVSNATPNVGTNVTFTITATNNGPSNATGVQVTDVLPAGVTYVPTYVASVGTWTPGPPGSGIWDIGSLANGASATLSIVVTVNTTAPTTNTATKTAEFQPDPNAANNSASATVTGQSADIAITKTVSNPTPNFGTNVTFTVTATNNGPSSATGVAVTDLLPAGLTYVSSVPSGTTTYASGTGIWTIGALANGANANLSIVATVTGSTLVTNTATKTAEDQPDPVAGNNSASVNVTGQAADIAVTKVVDNPTPNLGTNVTFTITATNNGPSNATGVVVTDLLPGGLTYVSSVVSAGTYTSGTGLWSIGGLANGANATLSLVATVTTTAATINTATKTGEVQPDPVAGNNSASVTVTGQAADIAIAKTVSNATPNINTNVTFTVTATNNGPSNATGVQVTDALPAGLTYVSSVPSGTTTYNSGTGLWTIGAMANGTNATLSIVATVTTTLATTNTATKTAEDQTDPVAGNNAASATVTGQAADIAVTKTVSNATPNWGTNVTFTITATNNGPSNATGVQVTDSLPAGLTYVSSVPSGATTYNSGSGIWDIGALANGANATLTITATVNTTAAATNTATKTAENQPDLIPGNNSASANITPVAADIAVAKTVSNTVPNVGSNVTFTITATNNGPSNATGVQVTDLLPGVLTYVSSATASGTYTSGSGLWDIGPLANGATATLSIVATVTTSGPVTNTATKTAEVQPDPVPGNNSSSATLTGQAADIAVTKTVSNATPNWGTNVTFTITATNNGPSNATGVQVTDSLPAGLTYVSSVPSGATTYNSGSGIWDIGALANSASATLTITATVNTTAAATNTATKTAENQPDPNSANNTASATVTPVSADIAIAKSVNNPTPTLGTNVTFTVTAHNNGPSNATGVQVTDVLPGTLTYVSSAPSQGTYNPGTGLWNIGAIANGATATLNIVATVTGLANSVNTATKTAEDQPDPVTSNDSASSRVACCVADIAVTKTVSNPSPSLGTNVTFTVTATNNGPSGATGLQLTDNLPAGLTYVSSATISGTYTPGTGIWNIGGLVNAASATLTITATVNTLAPVTNTACKTALLEADNTAADDCASASISAVAADIAVTKTVSNTTPNQNTNVTFTITATNNGPNNATGVQVTDLLPAGLTYVSSVASAGTTYTPVSGQWNIGAIANGANATLSIVALVTGTTPVTNTATKTAETQSDPVPGNNTAVVTVTGQAADIAITKTASSPTVPLGSNVTFTVTATNNGPSTATGVQVTDSLPAGLTYVSSVASAGTTYTPGTGIWNIGTLANGANVTLTIVAKATTTAAATNTATKTAEGQPDSTPGDDSASATVTGLSADVSVTKTVNNTTPMIDQSVTYTIVAHNLGPSTATGVSLSDLLPAGVTFVSYTATQGAYNSTTGVWFVGTMLNGSTVTLSIVVKVTSMGTIVNTVTILPGNYFDPNLTNNVSSATMVPDPALPDTSAPASPAPAIGERVTGLLITILVLIAGAGMFVLAGIGRRQRRRRQRHSPARLAIGLVAVLLSLGVASLSTGEVASYPSGTVASAGTQMIGGKVVDIAPPEPPAAAVTETFNVVSGPITPSRLRIPSIGVDAWVGAVGLRSNGAMDTPNNLWTTSWLSTGPRPGQAGNAVIAGHRGVGSPALFSHLENVQAGDRIYVSDAANNERIYVVTAVASLDLSSSTAKAVFAPTNTQQLVLITCFGKFMNSTRTYDHRLVVFSQPI